VVKRFVNTRKYEKIKINNILGNPRAITQDWLMLKSKNFV